MVFLVMWWEQDLVGSGLLALPRALGEALVHPQQPWEGSGALPSALES